MQRPPGLAPDSLDLIRLLASEQFSDFALQDRVDSGAIPSCGVCVAHAFRAFGIGEPDCIEFKSAHLAVCAVAEHDGERNAIKSASYRGEIGHVVLLCKSQRERKLPRRGARTIWFPRRHYPISPAR
jgi:hypothetical protein